MNNPVAPTVEEIQDLSAQIYAWHSACEERDGHNSQVRGDYEKASHD